MALTVAWHPSTDQGCDQIIAIMKTMIGDSVPDPEIRSDGLRVWTAPEWMIQRFRGMSDMIDILGPGEGEGDPQHEPAEKLRSLVYGNLKCHEPELGPWNPEWER